MDQIIDSKETQVKLYFCCASEDILFLDSLEKHLKVLQRESLLSSWHRREIIAGFDIENLVQEKIRSADIIIFLISPDFFSTDYIYNYEMQVALEREKNGLSVILPIYIRSVDYSDTLISNFEILPSRENPVKSSFWDSEDVAYLEIIKALKEKIYYARNEKLKRYLLSQNAELIKDWKSEKNDEKKEKIYKELSLLFVKQFIIAPFDLILSYFPIVATRSEPECLNWEIERKTNYDLVNDNFYNSERKYVPKLVVCDLKNNEPLTLYIKNYCKIFVGLEDNQFCGKGDVLSTINIPLLQIIGNYEKREPHWTFSSGDTGYGGILTYQPDLCYWKPNLKVKFRGIDKKYGTYKITPMKAGKLESWNNKFEVGTVIEKKSVIATVRTENELINVESPVSGTFSSWVSDVGVFLHQNQPICLIRTHPLLLILKVDYTNSWSSIYSCRSPISGIYIDKVPVIQKIIEIIPGKEISENTIVCGIRNRNILVAIYVEEEIGKILEANKSNGEPVEIGDQLFLIQPKFLMIRSPMIGKFFRRGEPTKPKHINIGESVSPGKVVCVIVAMKLNNEIESEISGVINKILVEDATPVEWDQPLFKVQVYED